MAELAEEILGIPVRLGIPKGVGGLADVVKSPSFATAIGLVQYASIQQMSNAQAAVTPTRNGLFGRLRRALSSAF
jgi:cell division ATPase FtsA